MYGKPFNEKRPYGTVSGIAPFAYEQDGCYYSALKEPVDENGKPLPLPPKAAEPEIPVTITAPVEDPDADIPEDEKAFDILAWAQGDETLKATPWTKIRAEAAMLLSDTTALTGKEAARKAVLAYYDN